MKRLPLGKIYAHVVDFEGALEAIGRMIESGEGGYVVVYFA